MGLIKPSSAFILIDGKDIQTNINGWQQNLGYVSQSTNLLDESIKNNIAFGVSEDQIDNKKLLDASKNSQIYEFISSLKEKFESQVGERGIALSGGQIQRIGIARELYRDPPIILLDEATSALDLDTEKEFLKCLDQLKGNKTIVFVSHRKSALENCNKIIDLNLDA
jgi:ABC-type bacteriocin/lantibiotic exporters, contain an N-terminal double-glycine peptidase domain